MGFHNITDTGGIGLALTGMTIVFVALILVSTFIAALPRVLPFVNTILPVAEGHHGSHMPSAPPAIHTTSHDEVVAAIGFALHTRRCE